MSSNPSPSKGTASTNRSLLPAVGVLLGLIGVALAAATLALVVNVNIVIFVDEHGQHPTHRHVHGLTLGELILWFLC